VTERFTRVSNTRLNYQFTVEDPDVWEKPWGGEIVNVIDAGYAAAIGLYGGHRYFHTDGDDMRCVSGELVAPVAAAFRAAIAATLK
jgi:hypothetical protein